MRARVVVAILLAVGLTGAPLPGGVRHTRAVGTGDVTPPSIVLAAQWTSPDTPLSEVYLVWDDLLDTSVTPSATDFAVEVDGNPDPVSSVTFEKAAYFDPTIALEIMSIHLALPVAAPGSVSVAYNPGPTPVRDLAGNAAEATPGAISADLLQASGFEPVLGVIDGSYAPDHIGLLVSDPVNVATLPAASAFTGARNGVPFTATAVSVFPGFLGRILDITIPVRARTGDTFSLDYTAPLAGGLESTFGARLPDFTGALVIPALVANDSASGTTGSGGGTVSSDVGDPGPTSQDPLATTISLPGAGSVAIEEGAAALPPPSSDYTFIGETIQIEVTPAATATSPLAIDFAIDDSILAAAGVDETTVAIFRDGAPVGPCTGPSGEASPDPCIASRTRVPVAPAALDYAVIQVLTSHASVWTIAAPRWSGFFAPVDNAPVINQVKAGSAVPVTFSLGANRGLAIFASGSPSSQAVQCATGAPIDLVEQTVSPGSATLTYDAASNRYTYVWKTTRGWTGCRILSLTFTDGTTRTATFQFK